VKEERANPVTPDLEKAVWNESDYDRMGWHDCAFHAMAFEPALDYPGTLLVDLDYIIEWVQPVQPDSSFSFWVCPATLVFDDAWGLEGDIDLRYDQSFQPSFDSIVRDGPDNRGFFAWTLEGHDFTILVHSRGFTQYLRHPPIHSPTQRLPNDVRQGLTFERRGFGI
jgi:hypothetical protein